MARADAARRFGMARAVEPPGELAPAAQDAPDALGHGAAIAAADEAAGAEERICDAIGRPVRTADDLVQEFHGGGNPRARSHRIPFEPAATMNRPAAQRLPRASRLREWAKWLALVAASVVFSLMVLELGLRALDGEPDGWQGLTHWPNLVLQARTASWDRHTVHDPRLGFVPRPNYHWEHGMAHYDAHSDRVTPAPAGMTLAEPPVLVLGDLFAHGDEINDEEAWPTRLQALLHRRVVNAAMSGYGIDQMVLRGEIEAAREKPAAIVLSFIADDVRRMEMKRVWGAEKPYFALVDGKLVERNVPVPPSPDPAHHARCLAQGVRPLGAGRDRAEVAGLVVRVDGRPRPRPAERRRPRPRLPAVQAPRRRWRAGAGGRRVRALPLAERALSPARRGRPCSPC